MVQNGGSPYLRWWPPTLKSREGDAAKVSAPSEADCVFCQIVRNESPAARVYEDDTHLAFMDRAPIRPGHLLVLPKAHFPTLLEMPSEAVGPLYRRVAHLAVAVHEALGADGLNVAQNNGRAANQIVFHVHVHVIPRYLDDGSHGQWPERREASLEELEATAARIRPHVGPLPTSEAPRTS